MSITKQLKYLKDDSFLSCGTRLWYSNYAHEFFPERCREMDSLLSTGLVICCTTYQCDITSKATGSLDARTLRLVFIVCIPSSGRALVSGTPEDGILMGILNIEIHRSL